MRCEDCNGTGRDETKTLDLAKHDAEFRHRVKHHGTYVRCWTCNGNGLVIGADDETDTVRRV